MIQSKWPEVVDLILKPRTGGKNHIPVCLLSSEKVAISQAITSFCPEEVGGGDFVFLRMK